MSLSSIKDFQLKKFLGKGVSRVPARSSDCAHARTTALPARGRRTADASARIRAAAPARSPMARCTWLCGSPTRSSASLAIEPPCTVTCGTPARARRLTPSGGALLRAARGAQVRDQEGGHAQDEHEGAAGGGERDPRARVGGRTLQHPLPRGLRRRRRALHRDRVCGPRRSVCLAQGAQGEGRAQGGDGVVLLPADVPRAALAARQEHPPPRPQVGQRLHDVRQAHQAGRLWRGQGAQVGRRARAHAGGHAVLRRAGGVEEQAVQQQVRRVVARLPPLRAPHLPPALRLQLDGRARAQGDARPL